MRADDLGREHDREEPSLWEEGECLPFEALHPLVRDAARGAWKRGDYRRAVSDAFEALRDLLRQLLESHEDGERLVGKIGWAKRDQVPELPLTPLTTKSERDMHDGVIHLLHGLVQYVRNPDAHGTRAVLELDRDEAFHRLAIISLCAKHVDRAGPRELLDQALAAVENPNLPLSSEAYVADLVGRVPGVLRGELCEELITLASRAEPGDERELGRYERVVHHLLDGPPDYAVHDRAGRALAGCSGKSRVVPSPRDCCHPASFSASTIHHGANCEISFSLPCAPVASSITNQTESSCPLSSVGCSGASKRANASQSFASCSNAWVATGKRRGSPLPWLARTSGGCQAIRLARQRQVSQTLRMHSPGRLPSIARSPRFESSGGSSMTCPRRFDSSSSRHGGPTTARMSGGTTTCSASSTGSRTSPIFRSEIGPGCGPARVCVRSTPTRLDRAAIERRLGEGAKVELAELDAEGILDVQDLLGHYSDELRVTDQAEAAQRVIELAADAADHFLMIVPHKVQADPNISTE